MTDRPRALATYSDYTLVQYASGERRIEHDPTRICSDWLDMADRPAIIADPSLMASWVTDTDMTDEA